MKKTKIIAASLALLSLAGLASCGSSAKTYEYALITDVGDIDDESFNQTAWEATKAFAEEKGKTYAYYRPTEDTNAARLVSIDQAIKKGAKVIVCPGYLFETPVYEAQTKYPDVKFVLLDGNPHTEDYATYKTESNVVGMTFKEEISGFLAGYAAVKEGNTALGFCGGMAVPAVQRFGTGFIQGADAAANALNANVTIKYYYAGVFQATDDATAKMKSWYTAGMDTVFACGGKVYQSVVEGIKSASKTSATWIGVDVDQASVSDKVLTSATKGLKQAVISSLECYYNNTWSDIGGQSYNLGLQSEFGKLEKKDYVELPTKDSSWRFKTFTQAEYKAVVETIKAGTVKINDSVTAAPTTTTKTIVTYETKFC